MSSSTPPPSPQQPPPTRDEFERLRLQLEGHRLDLERTKVFFERWRTDTEPRNQRRLEMMRSMVGYGQAGLKACFLLNGGATLALPTFAQIIGAVSPMTGGSLAWAIGAFCVGLVLAAVGALFAYISCASDQVAISHETTATQLQLNNDQNRRPDQTAFQTELGNAQRNQRRFARRASRAEVVAIAAAILSVASFGVGVSWGLDLLRHARPSSAASTAPTSSAADQLQTPAVTRPAQLPQQP